MYYPLETCRIEFPSGNPSAAISLSGNPVETRHAPENPQKQKPSAA
jgi:hypothetical protein